MITLARTVGWLTPAEQRAELMLMVRDVLATSATSFGEVDLLCNLNRDHELDAELQRSRMTPLPTYTAAHAAALACLGSDAGRERVLRALASRDEQEVQVAQAYLRHRPITDADELRSVTQGIAKMKGSPAQVRALETLARHHISDREILDELARLFAHATSLNVQRAIAEIFIRSDTRALATPEFVGLLRQHRLRSPSGEDLIDVLIKRLQSS